MVEARSSFPQRLQKVGLTAVKNTARTLEGVFQKQEALNRTQGLEAQRQGDDANAAMHVIYYERSAKIRHGLHKTVVWCAEKIAELP